MSAVPTVLDAPQARELTTPTSADLVMNVDSLDRMMRFAEMMAQGAVAIPQHLRGKPGDCLAVVTQAMQWGMNPFAVAQKTHFVNGAIGYEAQLINAVVIARAPIRERLAFAWFPECAWKIKGKEDKSPEHGVRVSATLRGESEPRVLEITMAQVGVRNSPLWEHDPRQQIAYLATKRWARLYCPDVILGAYDPDELSEIRERDMGAAEIVPPAGATRTDQVKSMLTGKAKAAPEKTALQAFVDRVNAAATLEALNALKADGEKLPEADRAAAGQAFKERRAFLRQAHGGKAETIDQDTGEITQKPFLLAHFIDGARAAAAGGRTALLDYSADYLARLPEGQHGEADEAVQQLLRGLPD